jgi:hypothetical protein
VEGGSTEAEEIRKKVCSFGAVVGLLFVTGVGGESRSESGHDRD